MPYLHFHALCSCTLDWHLSVALDDCVALEFGDRAGRWRLAWFLFLAAGPLPGAWAPLASPSLACGVDHLLSQVAKEVKAGDLAFMPG